MSDMAKKKRTRERIRELCAPCETIEDITAIQGLESAARREGKEFWKQVTEGKRRIKAKGFYKNPNNLRNELDKGKYSSRTDLEVRNPTLYKHVAEQFPEWLTERWPHRSDKGTHKAVAQRSNDSIFTHKTPDLVRLCCSLSHQFFPNPVSGLDILLVYRLNRHESHMRATHCLADGRSIDPIILVALHIRLNKLSSN
jgi:hypothetical protein